ncbi:D-aminoacyl-tRNA deacylase [Candidatus Entotheonella palauensis]|uniref:D-aminoacyl-tRNA deacylase n=1 Tax=Candidatus Entotheonella gemina TaxID=1429439 RepID=W4MDN2_9BACT|nr:D-aminoacyl-tRNA deacylase [Candidatus Entotheonella palauensis]ETX08308.1 MAG: D-tyrosyl-tRNA(Tyr) deacylase [Candidatus Entotheonella gemina]
MRALIQRVSEAQVIVEGETVGAISPGLLVLLGVQHDDTMDDVKYLASKLITLRIFEDAEGKMNCDLRERNGAVLVVSQFTLYADCRKGRRPSFVRAAPPALAEQLYEAFVTAIDQQGVPVATGRFGAQMQVRLVNDGPVTILLESPEQPHGV